MSGFRLRFSVAVVGVSIAIVASHATPGASPQEAPRVPQLVAPDVSFNFGTAEQGLKLVHQFTIRNAGTAPLAVTRLSLSQPGMTARLKPSIAPGEEAVLSIEWNTAGAKGAVEGRAVLDVNDPVRPQVTFVLTAVVNQAIEFLPYQAVYTSVYQGEAGRRTVRVVNHRERPFAISRLEQQGEHFHASIKPVEPGKAYELEVTVPPTVPPGRYTEAVFLYPDDPTMRRIMVPVNVLVKPDMYANPEMVDFGRVALKELNAKASVLDLLTQTVIVRKRAGNFSITGVTSNLPFLTVRRSPDGSSEAFRIDVGLVKDRLQPGPISGSIRIATDDKRFPELVVPVRGEIR